MVKPLSVHHLISYSIPAKPAIIHHLPPPKSKRISTMRQLRKYMLEVKSQYHLNQGN
jgi:hypothetical protein